jgi:pilus assembly protein CpaB
MKPKTLVLLCVAVGCGLVAMIGVQQAMSKPAEVRVEMVQVLEAQADIDPGVPLNDENVAFKEIPKDAAHADCVTTVEEYQQRSLKVAVVKGEYILKGKLSEKGQSGKSIQIPIGKVLVTINVDETKTASNMMKAGDIVDVSVTYDARTPTGVQSKTMTLLECITVFAIADQTKNDMVRRSGDQNIKARHVSLIVTSEEANALALAQRKGQLQLALRNPMDLTRRNTQAITENLLAELSGRSDDAGVEQGNDAESRSVEVAEAPKQDVHQFLAQSAQPATPVEAAAASAEPVAEETPKWEVRVYVGNEVQTFPFELEAATAPVNEDAKEAAQPKVESASAGKLLEKFGWSLPWAKESQDGAKSAQKVQAL